ncbi:MAG: PD-(D/E)XK nuclease family protein, partial [Desulfocucumaceae bacterium]
ARTISEALFELLVDLEVPSTLEEWSAQARAEGNLTSSGEHDRIWGQLAELLDQVVAAFGEDPLSPEKYRKVVESGLVSLRLGLIPPGLDQVTVASLDRSRNPAIRAALILGVNDGVFPARPAEDGILTDADREILAREGLKLAPGVRRKILDEQFLIYSSLTRSSEGLYISYSMSDHEGRALIPSRIISRLRELLPGLKEKVVAVEPSGGGEEELEFVAGSGRTLGYLSSRLREYLSGKENHPLWWDVYNWYTRDTASGDILKIVREGLFQKNIEKSISPALVKRFYGGKLKASVSRIERFNSCPFSHFLAYGLKIRERLHYKLTPPDMGEFFHLGLRLFAERVVRESLDWSSLDRITVGRMTGEIVDQIAPGLQNEILLSTARYRYMVTRLKRRLARAAATLAEHYARGKFRPVGLEVKFGPNEILPPVVIRLQGGQTLEIRGRIDRVDACRWEKGNHLLVVDYKSGYKSIDLADIYYGVNIQLPAYLDVAVANSRLLTGEQGRPGGIFYFTVTDPVIRSQGPLPPEEAERQVLKRLRMKGMVLADRDVVMLIDSKMERSSDIIQVAVNAGGGFHKNSPVLTENQFEVLGKHLGSLYERAGKSIFSGEVGIEPFKIKGFMPCRYCKFKAVCMFDTTLPENRPRLGQCQDNETIWQRMSGPPEVSEGE